MSAATLTQVGREDPAQRALEVRELPLDTDVQARIRPLHFHDAARVAELHMAAMGSSLWARLGHPFLTQLYHGLVNDPRFLGFAYVDDSFPQGQRIRGFIAGSQDTRAMFQHVARTCWFLLGPVAAQGLLRSPSIARQLLQTARYLDSSSADLGLTVSAESLFCSFEPELRGRRISGLVNKVLFDELLARGHHYVKITTETDNVGANRQLRSWGFAQRGRFRFYNKDMVAYVLDLQASPRVDPVSRHPAIWVQPERSCYSLGSAGSDASAPARTS